MTILGSAVLAALLAGLAAPVRADGANVAPNAAWDLSVLKDKTVPSTVADGKPLTFVTWVNPPPPFPTINPDGGMRFAHGTCLYGGVKGLHGIGDATPWSIDVDFTLEAKPDGYCGGVFQAMNYLKAGMRLVVGQDLKLTTEIYHDDGKAVYLSSAAPLVIGKPYKAKVAFDGKKATLYLNGQPDASIDAAIPSAFSGDCMIGEASGNSYHFNGTVRTIALTPTASP